ncbi:MAG: O-antigen ligase family protein [Chloroflexota bacterium]
MAQTFRHSEYYLQRREILAQAARERAYATRVIAFILVHVPLAFLIRWNPIFSTAHALITIGLGLLWLLRDRQPYRVIYLAAYITGAELLWRGTGANTFWETGKYATSLLLILAIFRYRLLSRSVKWPIYYFLLLIPSVSLLPRFDREAIAFNLAGPFALAVCSLFFSSISLNRSHIQRILLALIAPAVGLAILAAYGTFSTEEIIFTGASIRATAADIGPNQVSSILGLGALGAFFYALGERKNRFLRFMMIGIVIWLLAQALLTFSRGGFWTTIGAIVVAGFYMLRERRARTIFAFSTTFVLFVGYFLVFPLLNNFTGGTLETRFTDFDTTGRSEIIKADLIAYREHPLLGLGPGQSYIFHAVIFRISNPHTEFTRLLAEHGSLGLLALLILLWVAAKRVLAKNSLVVKAYTVSFTAWTFLFMYHAATRLVAPSFIFGLAAASFQLEDVS